VLAGYLPDPAAAVGAAGVLIQTTSLMYTVPMALAACVSTRVRLSSLTNLICTNHSYQSLHPNGKKIKVLHQDS
jgi:hypothetical protein